MSPIHRRDEKRKGRGCLGWGCLMLTSLLVLMLLVVGVGAALYYKVPQRVGLVKSPAEKYLSGTPDRQAAKDLKAELSASGIDTRGLDIYVVPVTGRDTSVAMAVLDASQGFRFKSARGRDPLIDFMSQLSANKAAKEARIEQVAINYRNEQGESLIIMTAPVDAVSKFAQGKASRQEFLQNLEGKVNWAAAAEESQKWFE